MQMRTGRPIAPLSLTVEERETLEGWPRRPKSPPLAFSTTARGGRALKRSTNCAMPAASLLTRRLADAGQVPTSSQAFATSMPT